MFDPSDKWPRMNSINRGVEPPSGPDSSGSSQSLDNGRVLLIHPE